MGFREKILTKKFKPWAEKFIEQNLNTHPVIDLYFNKSKIHDEYHITDEMRTALDDMLRRIWKHGEVINTDGVSLFYIKSGARQRHHLLDLNVKIDNLSTSTICRITFEFHGFVSKSSKGFKFLITYNVCDDLYSSFVRDIYINLIKVIKTS